MINLVIAQPVSTNHRPPTALFRSGFSVRITHETIVAQFKLYRLTPGITRRIQLINHGVLRMKAALFAVGCMPLLGGALEYIEDVAVATFRRFKDFDLLDGLRCKIPD